MAGGGVIPCACYQCHGIVHIRWAAGDPSPTELRCPDCQSDVEPIKAGTRCPVCDGTLEVTTTALFD